MQQYRRPNACEGFVGTAARLKNRWKTAHVVCMLGHADLVSSESYQMRVLPRRLRGEPGRKGAAAPFDGVVFASGQWGNTVDGGRRSDEAAGGATGDCLQDH